MAKCQIKEAEIFTEAHKMAAGLTAKACIGKSMSRLRTFVISVLALASLIAGAAAANEWRSVVLKASSFKDDGSGGLIIELVSGKTIQVSKEDWSSQWSDAIDQAVKNQEMETKARSSAEPPSESAAAAMIRSHCAAEWPDDYSMRKYCEDKQYDGLRTLRARQMTGPLSKIRAKCAREWPDDFSMRNYCEEKQLKALRELNR